MSPPSVNNVSKSTIGSTDSRMHVVPALLYDHAALEPFIDSRTMHLHHEGHHAAYVEQLNAAVERAPDLCDRSVAWLLINLGRVPREVRTTVWQSAGGHLNHSLFWRAMAPPGLHEPAGAFADAIVCAFGSIEAFKERFVQAGKRQFGSGWVWLVRRQTAGSALQIMTTGGHDSPLMRGYHPILVNDVWEHAYYLKHGNRREDYLNDWWSVANWEEAARRYEATDLGSHERWEDDGGRLLAAGCVSIA